MATDGQIEELHRFAAAIGLKRNWFQDHPKVPHYDLRPGKRSMALTQGATPVTSKELFMLCRRDMKRTFIVTTDQPELVRAILGAKDIHIQDSQTSGAATSILCRGELGPTCRELSTLLGTTIKVFGE